MVLGTGIDIVEVERIRKAMQKETFAQRFFTQVEREYCEAKGVQKYVSYAARFAGKEAFCKALGTGFRKGNFVDISIENDELGCPQLYVAGYYQELIEKTFIEKIHISLSHTKEWAVAQIILEGRA